jgi:hypothetical protein
MSVCVYVMVDCCIVHYNKLVNCMTAVYYIILVHHTQSEILILLMDDCITQ